MTINSAEARAEAAEDEGPSVYGYCPKCGAPGHSRERRLNGDDKCTNGHKYPSRDANKEPKDD